MSLRACPSRDSKDWVSRLLHLLNQIPKFGNRARARRRARSVGLLPAKKGMILLRSILSDLRRGQETLPPSALAC